MVQHVPQPIVNRSCVCSAFSPACKSGRIFVIKFARQELHATCTSVWVYLRACWKGRQQRYLHANLILISPAHSLRAPETRFGQKQHYVNYQPIPSTTSQIYTVEFVNLSQYSGKIHNRIKHYQKDRFITTNCHQVRSVRSFNFEAHMLAKHLSTDRPLVLNLSLRSIIIIIIKASDYMLLLCNIVSCHCWEVGREAIFHPKGFAI